MDTLYIYTNVNTLQQNLIQIETVGEKILNLATALLAHTFSLSSRLIVHKAQVKLWTAEHDVPKDLV